MPSLLGPADSFNSSSATIRPDSESRSRRQQPGQQGGQALGPTDSIGRSFESLIEGRAGVLQQEDQFQQYLQPLEPTPGPPSSTFNPLEFLNDGTGFQQQTQGHTVQPSEFFRPSSAASHRSQASLSSTDVDSTGYYTTDMDTDDGFAPPLTSPSPLNEIQALNLNAQQQQSAAPTWAHGFDAGSPLTGTIDTDALSATSSRAGPSRSIRGVPGKELEEKKRLDRLEHRRSINRRSAQKHRLRRKEEMETLQAQIRERDLEIRALKEALAASKAEMSAYKQIVDSMRKQ